MNPFHSNLERFWRAPGRDARAWKALIPVLGLAAWAWGAEVLPKVAKPDPSQPRTGLDEDRHLKKEPPRRTKGLDLVKLGWTYNCNECHRLLEPRWHWDRPMVEHEGIRLNHGNNRFCLNCHHPKNRNAFVDDDGSEISQDNVVQLCARCHGVVFRDWEAGVHGRRNGHWDVTKGDRTQLRCIQCHDPHDPKFKAMTALPGPTYPARAAGARPEGAHPSAGGAH